MASPGVVVLRRRAVGEPEAVERDRLGGGQRRARERVRSPFGSSSAPRSWSPRSMASEPSRATIVACQPRRPNVAHTSRASRAAASASSILPARLQPLAVGAEHPDEVADVADGSKDVDGGDRFAFCDLVLGRGAWRPTSASPRRRPCATGRPPTRWPAVRGGGMRPRRRRDRRAARAGRSRAQASPSEVWSRSLLAERRSPRPRAPPRRRGGRPRDRTMPPR